MNDPSEQNKPAEDDGFEGLFPEQPTQRDLQIETLQEQLAYEKDARREERFVGIVILFILLDVVFFSVIPSATGPLALLVLQLLILIPLAARLGMQEIAKMLDRVLSRMVGRTEDGE